MIWRIFVCLICLSRIAAAEDVVAGLSQTRIAIDTSFSGSEIVIFGAVKRETEIDASSDLGVIISVAGPSQPVTVRKKERWFGIWVNRSKIEVDQAPSFYAVATTAPLSELLSDVEDLRHEVSIPRAIRAVGVFDEVDDAPAFTKALIRIREDAELYQILPGAVRLSEDTLFDSRVKLPANLVPGDYQIRIFLTRNGQVVSRYSRDFPVQKVGLERFLTSLAHERPLIYGLLSIAIAIIAGWLASAVFRYLRGSN